MTETGTPRVDLEAELGAFAPDVRAPDLDRPDRLGGADVGYVVEDTAGGRLLLAARPDGVLLSCSYVPDDADADRFLDRLARTVSPRVLRGTRALDPARRQLAEFLAGERRGFDVGVDLTLASSFQRAVLTRLAATVDYGRTTTYGALAGDVGRPSAARAVGAALGANPLCVVLPCHRVVAASGALTGYAGGLEAKRLLLAMEASRTI
jgi:methylated-DNA-[protein]-cysteine S-methyltransferase